MGRARTIYRFCNEKAPVGERRIHLFEKHSGKVMPQESWLEQRGLPIIAEAMKKTNLLHSSELFEMIQENFDFDP